MNNRVSKAQPRRSRVRLSKSLQAELLRAIGIPSPAPADLPPDDFPRDDLVSSTKRQLDEVNQPPSKKARLSNAHPPEDESRGAQLEKKARQHTLRFLWDQMLIAELGQTSALQFPKPKPLSYASFLNDFVDPIPPCSATDPEHSSILEWLGSLGSDRDTRCRSDSYLHPVNDSPPRHLTGSAPAMGYRRDSDGFRVPPTPSSTGLRSSVDAETRSVAATDATGSTPSSSRKSLVEDQCYRRRNLAANNISMRPLHDQFPEHVDDIVQLVQQDRDSPGPSLEDIKQDATLNQLWMGAGEPKLEDYFRQNIFPQVTASDSLDRADRQPMAKRSIPNTGSKFKVSTPVPDMLYGYNPDSAFPNQQAQLMDMGSEPAANTQDLLYPFFVIEFKGDGPSGVGSIWVATNQCLGGSTSCVNIAERLNTQLRQCSSDKIQLVNSAAFSIAMRGTEARLYVSWKHNELDYYMAKVKSFLLEEPEHYIEFRKYVRNIIDWGKGRRLEEIRESLDALLEEGRKRTSAAAKSRMPPSADSASVGSRGSNKSRKTS